MTNAFSGLFDQQYQTRLKHLKLKNRLKNDQSN